jgi:hypothetical protein
MIRSFVGAAVFAIIAYAAAGAQTQTNQTEQPSASQQQSTSETEADRSDRLPQCPSADPRCPASDDVMHEVRSDEAAEPESMDPSEYSGAIDRMPHCPGDPRCPARGDDESDMTTTGHP